MNKILIIGQAPPIKKQAIPYDSTMLYDWFSEVGITVDEAQKVFDFEAMTDKIPQVGANGHIPPSEVEMAEYFQRVLKEKVSKADKVILLGASPRNFFNVKKFFTEEGKMLSLIHPSKRNSKMYYDIKS